MSRKVFLLLLVGLFAIAGLSRQPAASAPGSASDVKPIMELPKLENGPNETLVNSSFKDMDPTWVAGALINTREAKLYQLSNCLKTDAKPQVTTLGEVVVDDFIENSLALSCGWLTFLKAELNDKTRVELSIVRSGRMSIPNSAIDWQKLMMQMAQIPKEKQQDYGIVIGYVDYIVTAKLFTDAGNSSKAGAFGVTIGHTWYSKSGNTRADHRVQVVWAPISIAEIARSQPKADLNALAVKALQAKDSKGGKHSFDPSDFLAVVPMPK